MVDIVNDLDSTESGEISISIGVCNNKGLPYYNNEIDNCVGSISFKYTEINSKVKTPEAWFWEVKDLDTNKILKFYKETITVEDLGGKDS